MPIYVPDLCPHPHEEDVWCVLCGGTVCPYCTVELNGEQKLCRGCHHSLVELNGPMAPQPANVLGEATGLLNPEKAPLTFGFCGLLIGIYLLTAYPIFTEANDAILDRLSLSGPDILAYGQWERLITGNLVHANFTHLGFNVLSLMIFGSMLELRIHKGIYLLWLVLFMGGCDVLSLWLLPNASVGASGIAYGLQSAFLVMAARHSMAEKQGSLWQTLLSLRSYVFIMLLFLLGDGMDASNINIYGHLGGALAGAAAAMFYPLQQKPTGKDWAWLCLLFAGITAALFLWQGAVSV